MIQILRYGNVKNQTKYRKFICESCDCIFVADNESYISWIDRTDPLMRVKYGGIKCPCCGVGVETIAAQEVSDINGTPIN